MALLDFLKNKKEKDKAAEKKAAVVSVAKEGKKSEKKTEKKAAVPVVAEGKFSYSVVKEPHISEKGTILAERNTYIFQVYKNANKQEIAKSVEGIYGVNVLAVNMVTIPPKKRRVGRTEGFKKGYKKAMVTIKEGQKIEIF